MSRCSLTVYLLCQLLQGPGHRPVQEASILHLRHHHTMNPATAETTSM